MSTIIYKEKSKLYLAGYVGTSSNTFKTAYNAIQPTEEDKLETYSKLAGLGPIKLVVNGLRTFYGINSDGSKTIIQIHSDHSSEIKGNYVDFYILGGSADLEVFRSTGANPPYWNQFNQVQSNHLPEPLKGSGEL